MAFNLRKEMGNLWTQTRRTLSREEVIPESVITEELEERLVKRGDCPSDKISAIKLDYCAAVFRLTGKPINDVTFETVLFKHKDPSVVMSIVLNGNDYITKLPPNIGLYSSLLVLDLRDNWLEEIPWSIVYLKKLEVLNLSYNMLTSLTRVIGHLPSLVTLDLTANHITYLPTDLLNLTKLETLQVDKNKGLVSPPLKECLKGKTTIFGHLEARKKRQNVWHGATLYITDNVLPPQQGPKSLFEICIECILDCKVIYIQTPYVPPLLQKELEIHRTGQDGRIQLAKCSECKKYYTTREQFDLHFCTRKT